MKVCVRSFSILKAAFRNDQQNCLREHDFQLILAFYTRQIEEKTKEPISENLRFLLEMYCQGSIYMTVQWVLGERKSTPQEMAKALVSAMPSELYDVMKQLNLV